jgi:hypothetical protein
MWAFPLKLSFRFITALEISARVDEAPVNRRALLIGGLPNVMSVLDEPLALTTL